MDYKLIANTIRGLSMDGIQAANSGQPGLPLGMADDRRFSVIRTDGPLAELPWFHGDSTVRAIERELVSFAAYLHTFPYAEVKQDDQ